MKLLEPTIQAYVEQHTDPEPPVLAELNRATHLKAMKPRMLSGHYQGRLLAMLAKLIRPAHVLDIGTYTGYSALCFAEGLAEGGQVTTIDRDPERLDFAQPYFRQAGLEHVIHGHAGDAAQLIPQLTGPFDLVFIDAHKPQYIDYYEAVLPKVPSGGVLLSDNVLWSGKVVDPSSTDRDTKALRAFNDHVQADQRVEKILLPIRDGVYLIRKL